MMQAAVSKSSVQVLDKPQNKTEATENYMAFSDEWREQHLHGDMDGTATRTITCVPRMVDCYGWMRIKSTDIPESQRPPDSVVDRIPRSMPPDKEYIAILFEFIEDGRNDKDAVEKVSDFLWHAGFCLTCSPLERNWRSGVLVDWSDVVDVNGFGWVPQLYGPRSATQILIK